jgi:plastocyanin
MLRDTPRSLALSLASISAAATLRIRGVNTGNVTHTIGIRLPGAAGDRLCVTPNIAPGGADTLTVENLQAGDYVVFCSIHPTTMLQNLKVS